jgi:hypothetical protein
MSPKRTPQTAAKRQREQAVREKRERKAEKKRAATLARKEIEGGPADASPETSSLSRQLSESSRPNGGKA